MNTRIDRYHVGRWACTGLAALALGLAGCNVDHILKVTDPETVNPGTLEDPSVLDVVINGAKGDFTGAYSGSGGDAFLSTSALLTDELFSSGTFSTRTATDRRNQQQPADGNTSDGAYTNFQRARRSLHQAAIKVENFRGKDDPAYSDLKALEGYTYVGLGEGYCSAIPISDVDESGAFVYGAPETVSSIFTDALAFFDEALGNGGKSVAAVGKGRALLDLGQFDAAAAAVSGVATDYVYFIRHSVSGASNPIYSLQGNGRYSVSDVEGGNGLPYRSADDPRVPWIRDPDQPNGFDAAYPLYKTMRYTGFDSPVPLASGVEARLIEAEAALQKGDVTTWLSKLNNLRQNVGSLMAGLVPTYAVENATLPDLTDPGSAAARRDVMFQERGFWLFLTGHRLGDMRRLVAQYGLAQAQVYPTGAYHKGGEFGDDVAFPLDFDETNNKLFTLSACNVKQAN